MKYQVTLKEIEIYVMEVSADCEEEAIDKAYELIGTKKGKLTYHDDSDSESDIEELED